jgi:hypothetical protein
MAETLQRKGAECRVAFGRWTHLSDALTGWPARRDWAEAVWAEAYEVPAGWPRLAILCVGFPIMGVVMGFMGAGLASLTGPRSAGGRSPGSPGPGSRPDLPDGGRLADAEALA